MHGSSRPLARPDFEYVPIDGTVVKVHRHGTGAKGTQNQAIGKSRGGLTTKTTKLVALVDARGNIARFVLLPGSATAQLLLLQPGSNYPLITLRLPVARDRCDVRRNGPAGLLWFPTRHATLRRGRTISLAVERW